MRPALALLAPDHETDSREHKTRTRIHPPKKNGPIHWKYGGWGLNTIFLGFFWVKFRKKLRNLTSIAADGDGKLGSWPDTPGTRQRFYHQTCVTTEQMR